MTQKAKGMNSVRNARLIVGVIVVVAVVAAVAVVLLSGQNTLNTSAFDYSQIPQERLSDGGFVLGDADAPVTIVAFEDYLCGHCQQYKPTIDQFVTEFVAKGLARFEYRFMPVVSPAYSPLTAKLTECAETLRPGAFWRAHDVMYEVAGARQYSDKSSRTFAESMDMSYADLLKCTADAKQVDKDIQLGNQLGVTGTPTVFVRYGDGYPQPSPLGKQPTFSQLKTIVESAS